MTTSKPALLDSNILVFADNEDSPNHQKAKELREKARNGEINAYISPQIILEFFAIITNPKRVEKPLSFEDAYKEAEKYLLSHNIKKIHPKETTLERTLNLYFSLS